MTCCMWSLFQGLHDLEPWSVGVQSIVGSVFVCARSLVCVCVCVCVCAGRMVCRCPAHTLVTVQVAVHCAGQSDGCYRRWARLSLAPVGRDKLAVYSVAAFSVGSAVVRVMCVGVCLIRVGHGRDWAVPSIVLLYCCLAGWPLLLHCAVPRW